MSKKGFAVSSLSITCAICFPLLSYADSTAVYEFEKNVPFVGTEQHASLQYRKRPAQPVSILHDGKSSAWQENDHFASNSHFKAEKLENVVDLAPAQGDLKSSQMLVEKTIYRPRASLGPFYQTHAGAFGLFDIFLPYTFDSKSILFVDGRYYERGNSREYNVGLGVRQITSDSEYLWTAYLFYDNRKTRFSNNFGQVTIGGDFQTGKWYFNTNGYIPVGKRDAFVSSFNAAFLCQDNTRICYGRGVERSMGGWDAEAGYDIWRGLRGYAGMYVFAADRVKTAVGPNFRLQYDITARHNRLLRMFDKIALIANWRDDQLAGSVWYAGARFDITLGKRPPDVGFERRMTSFIRRDLNVEMSSDGSGSNAAATEPVRILRNDFDDQETQVALVSSAADLAAAAGDARDNIIGPNGTITTAAVTNLQTNQILEGGVFSFTREGTNFSVQVGQNGGMSRGGAAGFDLIGIGSAATIGQNVTVENMNFNNAGAGAADFVIDHAASANTIGTVVIRGNTQNTAGNFMSILLGAANVTDNASVLIQGNSLTNVGVAAGSIIGVSGGGAGSSLNVNFDSNLITSTVVTNGSVGFGAGATGIVNVSMTNNNMTVAVVAGFSALNVSAGGAGSSVNLITATGNTVTSTSALTSALFLAGNVNVSGDIANNTLASNPNGQGGVLQVSAFTETAVNINGSIRNNVITNLGAVATTAGINLSTPLTTQSISVNGGIINNTIITNGARGISTATSAGVNVIIVQGLFGNIITGFAVNQAIFTNAVGAGTNNLYIGNGFAGSNANLGLANNGLAVLDMTLNATTNVLTLN